MFLTAVKLRWEEVPQVANANTKSLLLEEVVVDPKKD